MSKPLKIWVTPPGPNPWKVVIILEELGVPYEIISLRFEDIKFKPFIDVNPNGRVPAIEDPNTGLILWESAAIIQYLEEKYDVDNKLTYSSLVDRHHLNQWLMFQVSGQGPYYGQSGWFQQLHPENVPSAKERYSKEVKRILAVLNDALHGKQWLVGDKCTFADLSFLMWNTQLQGVLGELDKEPLDEFANVKAWHERMLARDSVKKAFGLRESTMAEQNLGRWGAPKDEDTREYVARENNKA